MTEADDENTTGKRCFRLRQIFSSMGHWFGSLCASLGRSLRFQRRQYIEDYDEPAVVAAVADMNDGDISNVQSIHAPERHQRPLTLTARTRTKPRTPTLIAIQQALGQIDDADIVSAECGVSIPVEGDILGTGTVDLEIKPSCDEIEEEVYDVESCDDLDLK